MIKRFLILPNERKDCDLSYTNGIVDFLLSCGQRVFVCKETYDKMQNAQLQVFSGADAIDIAVVLGGDGTILRWAHRLLETDIPILGINLGRMGYLAEVEPNSAIEALKQIITGQYVVEKRMILSGVLTMEESEEKTELVAFNDIVVHRGMVAGMIHAKAYINDTFMNTFTGDGIVVSTPSGSTAYNFSAGGPIINPVAENIIFTPICCHSTMGRSIVVTGEDKLTITLSGEGESELPCLYVDGGQKIVLKGRCRLNVERSESKFSLIRVTDKSFFEILRHKMRFY